MEIAGRKPLSYTFATVLTLTGLFSIAADEVLAQTTSKSATIVFPTPNTTSVDIKIQRLRDRTALKLSIRDNADFEATLQRMEFAKSIRKLEDEKKQAEIDALKRKLAGMDKKTKHVTQKKPKAQSSDKNATPVIAQTAKEAPNDAVKIPTIVQKQIAKKVKSVTSGLDTIMDKPTVQHLMNTCDLAATMVMSQGTLVKSGQTDRMAGSLKATVHLESSSGTTKVASARQNPFQVEKGTLVDYVGNYGQLFAAYARAAKTRNPEAVPVSGNDINRIEKLSLQINNYKKKKGRNIPLDGALANSLKGFRRNDFVIASMTAIHFERAREEVLEPCTNVALKKAVDEGFDYLTHWRGINGAKRIINSPNRKNEALRISGVHEKVIEAIVVAEASSNRFGKATGKSEPTLAQKKPKKINQDYATIVKVGDMSRGSLTSGTENKMPKAINTRMSKKIEDIPAFKYNIGDMGSATYAAGASRPAPRKVTPSAKGRVYASLSSAYFTKVML